MGIISTKIKNRISTLKKKKVINIKSLYKAKIKSENAAKTIKTPEELKNFHPIHAVYISTQNLVSIIAENLSTLPEMNEYYDKALFAEDEYKPSGPPVSPLSGSYFTCWAFFDLTFGADKETIGSCCLDIGSGLGISKDYIEIISLMQKSRMGIYEYKGIENNLVYLTELFTNKDYVCISPTGYQGKKGEIWYVRLFPPPFDEYYSDLHLAFTTPYVIRDTGKNDWMEYFKRTLNITDLSNKDDMNKNYHNLMKYGLSVNYWHEYLFLSYYDYITAAVFLGGIPDKL